MLVDMKGEELSISRQCDILEINRSSMYYKSSKKQDLVDLEDFLMNRIDEIYTKYPFYGQRRIKEVLRREGYDVSRGKVRRLMKRMGLVAIYPKRRLSIANKLHKKYPYLLSGIVINRPNQVWATDITYIRLKKGFAYLTAIMDWYSRYVVSWELSITMDVDFCMTALKKALFIAKPEIFNSDQGSQFTSSRFTDILKENNVKISMDGKGRVYDNIFVERLWRTVKYEEIFLKEYNSVWDLRSSLTRFFEFYNNDRPHSSLGNKTPAEVYFERREKQAG